MDVLQDLLKDWVKVLDPNSLQEVIKKARGIDLGSFKSNTLPKKYQLPNNLLIIPSLKNPPPKLKLDIETRQQLRRQKTCFTCKDPWVLRHCRKS